MAKYIADSGVKKIDFLRSEVFRFKNIIFDLDNTIFPEEIYDLFAFRAIGSDLLKLNDKDAYQFANKAIALKAIDRAFLFNRLLQDEKEICIQELVDFYQNYSFGKKLRYFSIRPFLIELYELGKDLYIVTNGHPVRQNNKIRDIGIERYFKSIYVCHPDTDNPLKPNPQVLQKIINSRDRKEFIMVGDDKNIDGIFAEHSGISFFNFSVLSSDFKI